MPRKTPPVPVPVDHAYCFGCASVLPSSAFHTDRRKPTGHACRCKVCTAQKAKLNQTFRAEAKAYMACQFKPTPLPDNYAPEVLFNGSAPPDFDSMDRFRRKHR